MRTRSMTMSTCDSIHCLHWLMFFMWAFHLWLRASRRSGTPAAAFGRPCQETNALPLGVPDRWLRPRIDCREIKRNRPGEPGLIPSEPGADEGADHRQFLLPGDSVALDEFVPLDVDTFGFQQIDLFPHGSKRNEGIIESVGYQQTLLPRDRRQLQEQSLRFMDVAADADQSGEEVGIAQADFDGHQAALGKAEEHGLVGAPAARALFVKQFKQERAAPLDAGARVAGKIIPGIAAEILVGRIDQQVIQPWQSQRRREPAITLDAVAQSVQN